MSHSWVSMQGLGQRPAGNLATSTNKVFRSARYKAWLDSCCAPIFACQGHLYGKAGYHVEDASSTPF
eukprot:1309774-Amphidinium_carterae.1